MLALSFGCSNEPVDAPDTTSESPTGPGGKGDVIGDDVVEAECSFDRTWLVEASSELEGVSTTYTIDDLDQIPVTDAAQIFQAMAMVGLISGGEDLDVVFDAADGGEIAIVELELSGDQFDWVLFFAGDTEVGVIFERDSTTPVAEVSDGDIKGCAVGGGSRVIPTDTYTCSFDMIYSPDSSEGLEELAGDAIVYTINDAGEIPAAHAAAIFKVVDHVSRDIDGEDFDVVFELADDGVFDVFDYNVEGDDHTWVRFFAGDTEVGAILDAAGHIIAEISDGDVIACVLDGEHDVLGEDFAEVSCSFEHRFSPDSSSELGDIAGEAIEYGEGAREAIPEDHASLIFRAVKHLTFLSGDEDFDVMFSAADDGLFELFTFELGGQTVTWVRFFAGDTEVGVVFDAAGVVIAEVGDGDIQGCVAK